MRDVLGEDVVTELRRAGMQIAELPILLLDGNLQPGSSGAPVVDTNGNIVGVVEGGLRKGDAGTCWAVPISNAIELIAEHSPPQQYTNDEVEHYRMLTTTLFGELALQGSHGLLTEIEARAARHIFLSIGLVAESLFDVDHHHDLRVHAGLQLSMFSEIARFGEEGVEHALGLTALVRILPFGPTRGTFRAPMPAKHSSKNGGATNMFGSRSAAASDLELID